MPFMSTNKKNNSNISIEQFKPHMAEHFYNINAQWLNDMFVVEPIDEKVLSDPQKYIIDQGGNIWFARHPQLGVVGTCAVKNAGEAGYELTKMGVLSSARGLKVGETLLKHVLNDCMKMGLTPLFLLTNHNCEAAIHLYEKNGFVHDDEIKQKFAGLYDRSDVFMRYHPHTT